MVLAGRGSGPAPGLAAPHGEDPSRCGLREDVYGLGGREPEGRGAGNQFKPPRRRVLCAGQMAVGHLADFRHVQLLPQDRQGPRKTHESAHSWVLWHNCQVIFKPN